MILKNFKADLSAILYSVYLFRKNLTKHEIISIQNTLRRYNKKYPYVSYLLTVSNTDSKYCVRRTVKTKSQRGRPVEVVIGKKIPMHIHLSVIGDENHSAYKYLVDIQKAFEKRFGEKCCMFVSKGRKENAKNFIRYSLKQASMYRKSGIFNEILEKEKVLETNYL